MDILNIFALYTVLAVWCLGGFVAILLLTCAVLWLAWHVYREAYGWPNIVKAMRLYEEQQRAERHARNVAAIRGDRKKES